MSATHRGLIVALCLIAFGNGLKGAPPVAAKAAEPDPAERAPLRVAICFGPGKKQLDALAKHMESEYRVACSLIEAAKAEPKKGEEATPAPFQPGLEPLESADVIVSNLYRTWAPPEQLDVLKKHFTGKPVVGLRKAHHGFQNWLSADQEVFGVRYRGHYFGKEVTQTIVPKHAGNPLLKGLDVSKLPSGGLYGHSDLSPEVDVLIEGGPKDKPPMPQTWTRVDPKTGRRVFYTRYDPDDIAKDPAVRDMVVRAIFWAAGKDLEQYRRPPSVIPAKTQPPSGGLLNSVSDLSNKTACRL